MRVLCPVVVTSCLWLTTVSAEAQLAQCTSDLETLGAAASSAHSQSSELESIRLGFITRQEELVQCQAERERVRRDRERRGDPTTRGLDACRGTELLARTLAANYESAVAAAREGLSGLATAVQTVERSCQVPLAAFVPVPASATRSPACVSFLRSRADAPLEALRVVCRSEMSEEECAACLGER